MPTPSERLQNIIDANVPSEMIFKPIPSKVKDQTLILEGVVTKKKVVKELPGDIELQKAFNDYIDEQWDVDEGKYFINSTVDTLWNRIRNSILNEYEATSSRCDATKRKTQQFIRDIKIDDKHLPNYLIQVFLKIKSPDYDVMSSSNRQALFEQFESLRRTYGKRSR